MKQINWGDVKASSNNFDKPVAGGYVIIIRGVENNPEKEYLKLTYDIIDAYLEENKRFVGYYGDKVEAFSDRRLPHFFVGYSERRRGWFKAFLNDLEKSGNAIKADDFDGNEKQFVGMSVGAVLGEREYMWNGEKRTKLDVAYTCDIKKIEEGKLKIADVKRVDGGQTAPTPASDLNVPF